MRYMPDGKGVANFSVASDRVYTKDGEKVTVTTWFRVSVWGKQAESCNKYLSKGSMVLVEGSLNPDKETGTPRVWESNGRTGASYDVNARDVRFLSTNGGQKQAAPNEDDIPF
jgi:single-strand DNA-binding protein